jgi:CheY-like chemotaxis protein
MLFQAQETDAATAIIVQVISILPSLLWFGLAVLAFSLLYPRVRDELLPRIGGLEAFGVVVTFARQELDRIIEERDAQVSEQERSHVMRRAQRLAPVLQGARILWVDDQPENNRTEQRILTTLGVEVDSVRSTDEALNRLKQASYDVLISDMARDTPDAGLQLLGEARKRGSMLPTVFYVGYADPARGTPPYALGIADQPADLLHYVFDALERQRG